jgi:NAD(P)H-nitrite reductase large subunit
MFVEADEKHEVATPRQFTFVHVIEIEDKTNETLSERKSEINGIDVNDKSELNNIENENVIVINNDDRNTYKNV